MGNTRQKAYELYRTYSKCQDFILVCALIDEIIKRILTGKRLCKRLFTNYVLIVQEIS